MGVREEECEAACETLGGKNYMEGYWSHAAPGRLIVIEGKTEIERTGDCHWNRHGGMAMKSNYRQFCVSNEESDGAQPTSMPKGSTPEEVTEAKERQTDNLEEGTVTPSPICDTTRLRCCKYNSEWSMVPHKTWGSTPRKERSW